MTTKRGKDIVALHGRGHKRVRDILQAELAEALDREVRGTVFVTQPNGTVVTDHDAMVGPWRPVFFFFPKKGHVRVASPPSSVEKSDLEDLCMIRWRDLRESMSAEHLELVRVLMNALYEQARVARRAVQVASLVLDAQQSRKETSKESGPGRPSPVADRVTEVIARLIKKNFDPYQSIPDIAQQVGCSKAYVRKVLKGKNSETEVT